MLYTIKYNDQVLLEVDKFESWRVACDDNSSMAKVTEEEMGNGKVILLRLNKLPGCITNSMICA